MKSYSEKLRDPRWQKKRLEILNRDDWTCKFCKSKEIEFHVHHETYIKRREPWDYPDENFTSLCKDCHLVVENFKSERKVKILSIAYFNKRTGLAVVADDKDLYICDYDGSNVTMIFHFTVETFEKLHSLYTNALKKLEE